MTKGYIRSKTQEVEASINQEKIEEVKTILAMCDYHDLIKILTISRIRHHVFALLEPETQAKVFVGLSTRIRQLITAQLSDSEIHAILHFMDGIEQELLLSVLSKERRDAIEPPHIKSRQEDVTELMQFFPDSAGELISFNFIIAREDAVVADIAAKVERYLAEDDTVPVIIATDNRGKVFGRVFFAHLINAEKDQPIKELSSPVLTVGHHVDQEVLVKLIRKSPKDDLIVAVDEDRQPIGVIHAQDLLAVIDQETTEDILSFAGVYEVEKPMDPIRVTVLHRYRWLIINLVTSLFAVAVISMFNSTISKIVLLAAYMPIVAGMGGNAGTQTLAVVVRGLALGEIEKGYGRRVVFKELIVGVLNGLISGAVVAVIATVWHQAPILGLVLAGSMIINLIIAGFFGAVIPVTLQKLKIDPAVSSSVFLTTITDVVGFFVFLGLASLVML